MQEVPVEMRLSATIRGWIEKNVSQSDRQINFKTKNLYLWKKKD